MLILLNLVFLFSNFLFIKAEDSGNVIIDVKAGVNCTTNSSVTLTDGQNINLIVTPYMFINHGWWKLVNSAGSRELYSDLKTDTKQNKTHEPNTLHEQILHTSSVDKSMEGTWVFSFFYFKNNEHFEANKKLLRVSYNGSEYIETVCSTNVIIAPKPTTAVSPITDSNKNNNELLIIACAFCAIFLVIIILQAAYIVFLKDKARKLITLNTHNNLSKKSESVPNDTARYCSNPGQKMMKLVDPVDDDNRDSVIYEAPNIEISGNQRMPKQPPPPEITTMPRTLRPDHNMRISPQAMLASAMNSPARSPMTDNFPPNFQRPKLEREISVTSRPPLPLPLQGHPLSGHSHPGHPYNNMFQEVYEQMETEDNTYEPPPIINTMPPRLAMPPKNVPTGNLLDVKDNTLKMRQGNKPIVTPKPQQLRHNMMAANELEQAFRRRNNDTVPKPNPGHMSPMQQEQARRRPNGDAQTNELEEAFRKRNNVMQVPIVSIPNPSSRGSPKQKPPPALKSMPRGPPLQPPVQEEIYYNENQASSDEEWTYEPLKPLNSYDPNIYNI